MIVNLMMHSILPEKMGTGAAVLAGEGTKQVVGIEDGNNDKYGILVDGYVPDLVTDLIVDSVF